MKNAVVFSFVVLLMLSSFLFADVKYVTTTTLELEGTVGTMMKLFGGGKPTKTVEYYKGDVKRSDTFDNKENLESSQIIDLDKELLITISHDKKEYTQMTFDEWKEMIQATIDQIGEEEYGEKDDTSEAEEEPQAEVDWDLKVDIKETGESEMIAGKKSDKVILTLDLDAEVTSTDTTAGAEPETAKGGIIVTSSQWMYNGGDAAKKEMDDFNLRFAEKIGFLPGSMDAKQMMSKVVEQNSQLGEAIQKMQEESQKLQGVAMRSTTLYETKVDPETLKKMEEEKAKQQEQEEAAEIPTSVGGLLGGFGKKMVKKHMEKKDEGPKERNALMTSTTEVVEFETTALEASLFQVPADYKLVEADQVE